MLLFVSSSINMIERDHQNQRITYFFRTFDEILIKTARSSFSHQKSNLI